MTPPAPKPSVRVIEELRAAYEAGTKGEWSLGSVEYNSARRIDAPNELVARLPHIVSSKQRDGNAALIVAMHRHLPALLAVVEAAGEVAEWFKGDGEFDPIGLRGLEKLEDLAKTISALDATGGGL